MPVRSQYDHLNARYNHTVRCGGCSREWSFSSESYSAEARDEVTRDIRFLPGPGRYHSRCRSCEREYGRNRQRTPRATVRPSIAQLDRRFGVEIELIFPPSMSRHTAEVALNDAGLGRWRVKSDGSLHGGNGQEVVSPPLSGEAGLAEVRTACRVLRTLGAKPNRSCGMHVHHEIRDLSVASVKSFVRSYFNNQGLIDGLLSPSRRGQYYAMPHTATEIQSIERMRDIGSYSGERYKAVNLRAFSRYGTIELRQHQGTCDPEKVVSWIKFAQAMLETSREAPVARHSTVRAFITALGDRLDETARTFLLGRAVEFAHAAVM